MCPCLYDSFPSVHSSCALHYTNSFTLPDVLQVEGTIWTDEKDKANVDELVSPHWVTESLVHCSNTNIVEHALLMQCC